MSSAYLNPGYQARLDVKTVGMECKPQSALPRCVHRHVAVWLLFVIGRDEAKEKPAKLMQGGPV